jgi:Flp pilus assembly protein TadD
MKVLILLFGLLLMYGYGDDAGLDYYVMKKHAYSAYEQGKSDAAISMVKRFIDTHPRSLHAQNLLAVLYYWQGEKAEARRVLEKLLKKSDFPQAKRLLARIGTAKKDHEVKKAGEMAKKVQQVARKDQNCSKMQSRLDDLQFMQSYILTHPDDIESRKVLMHYYVSVGEKAEAAVMAKEILQIDPEDRETLALLQDAWLNVDGETEESRPDAKRDKLVALLQRYKNAQAYSRFLNLYQALINGHAYLPKYMHLEALNIAVTMQKYRLARRILMENDFPVTAHLRELRALLDRKLRVAYSL